MCNVEAKNGRTAFHICARRQTHDYPIIKILFQYAGEKNITDSMFFIFNYFVYLRLRTPDFLGYSASAQDEDVVFADHVIQRLIKECSAEKTFSLVVDILLSGCASGFSSLSESIVCPEQKSAPLFLKLLVAGLIKRGLDWQHFEKIVLNAYQLGPFR